MNEEDNSISKDNTITTVGNISFSPQSTGMVETTFAETLGLSMHNAIANQQSSQMTASASITNACARLLQAQVVLPSVPHNEEKVIEVPSEQEVDADNSEQGVEAEGKPKRRFNPFGFMKKKPQSDTEGSTVDE